MSSNFLNSNKRKNRTQKIVIVAMLTVLVVVLQLLSAIISPYLPVSISLVLVPIVIGAIYFGPAVGAYLGAIFGIICILNALFGLDAGTFVLLNINPALTCVLAIGKGVLAGLISGLAFKLTRYGFKFPVYPSALIASILCPIVNTGVFFVVAMTFYRETLLQWANGPVSIWGVFSALLLINFVVELALNIIIGPVLTTLLAKNRYFKLK